MKLLLSILIALTIVSSVCGESTDRRQLKKGRRKKLKNLRRRWTRPSFTTMKCEGNAALPTCSDRRGNDGVWVCRTMSKGKDKEDTSDDVVKTMCINPERGIESRDKCGACPEVTLKDASTSCDASCSCKRGNEDGIKIEFSVGLKRKFSRCVSPSRATSIINFTKRASCCTPVE